MSATAPRYAPHQPLPPYPHRLGVTPHPRRHADGHSFGQPEPASAALDRDNWRRHEAWLVGVDLFNAGCWWEAHEWWEAAWNATSEEGARCLLQGLIQLAAAWLQRAAGNERGRAGLWRRGRGNLAVAASSPWGSVGLDIEGVIADADAAFASGDAMGQQLTLAL